LLFHIMRVDSAAPFEQPVGKGRFPVVYMRDYGKVTNPVLHVFYPS